MGSRHWIIVSSSLLQKEVLKGINLAAQTTAKKVTLNLHLNTNKCKQEIKLTSRSVASKVATGEDDGGEKDCSLSFRS